MYEQVKDLIVRKFSVPENRVTGSVTLEELGLNSLDMVEFAELATETFGTDISDDEVVELNRVDRIAELLEHRLAQA